MTLKKIAIHSVPRSGSSWLGEIINSSPEVHYAYQPLFSYEFKSRLNESSNVLEIDQFFRDLLSAESDFVLQSEDRESGKKPKFDKNDDISTVVYKEVRYHYILENMMRDPDVKVICLIRNPLSVISSWYKAPREFRKDLGWNLDEQLILADAKNEGRKEDYFGLQKWVETVRIFEALAEQFPNRCKIVVYQDLIENTDETVRDIFDFLSLSFSKQTEAFISSKKEEVNTTYSVMKTKSRDDGWKYVLPENVVNQIVEYVSKECLDSYIS